MSQITQLRYQLNSNDITLTLVGFARLNIKLQSYKLLENYSELLLSMNYIQLSNNVWSLGKLGCSFLHFSELTKSRLLAAISLNLWKMNPQSVSNTLQGLSWMNIHWNMFDNSFKNVIFQSLRMKLMKMKEQEVSSFVGLDWIDSN